VVRAACGERDVEGEGDGDGNGIRSEGSAGWLLSLGKKSATGPGREM